MKIVETIGDTPETNSAIDDRMTLVPSDLQVAVLDGLEIIKNAGVAGVGGVTWLQQMKQINPDLDEASRKKVLQHVLRDFTFLIKRNGDRFVWNESAGIMPEPTPQRAAEPDDDIDPALHAAATQQIAITDAIISAMQNLQSFTEDDILPVIMAQGLPASMAKMFFDHTISTMVGKTLRREDGRYTLVRDVKKTTADHMDALRGLGDKPKL